MGKILLIDHDEAQAQRLAQALQADGHEVALVTDGSDGLAQAHRDVPNCIVLAVELVNFSGYSVCNKVKRDRELAAIPLLLVSAQASAETFAEHSRLRTHAEAYAHKPYDLAAVSQTVANLLGSPGLVARAKIGDPARTDPPERKPARFGEEPSAVEAPFFGDGADLLEPAPVNEVEPAAAADAGPLPGQNAAKVHYTTDAQLLLESTVDPQDATRIYENYVLGEGHQGSASPAELIVEALGDIDEAQARARAAQSALQNMQAASPEPQQPAADLQATEAAGQPADAGPSTAAQASAGGEGAPSPFETHLVDALRARVAELESSRTVPEAAGDLAVGPEASALQVTDLQQRLKLAEAARDEALVQLEAQKQTLAQIRGLLQHVGRA